MRIAKTVLITLLTLYCLVIMNKAYGVDIPKPLHIIVLEHYLESVQVKSESEEIIYYDIPLSNELQDFTKNQAQYEEISYELILSIMEVESSFDSDVVSITNDVGIMQINKSNFTEMYNVFGFTDIMNVENNIVCGIYLLKESFVQADSDLHKALMVYNMGQFKAKEYWESGIYESKYSRKVVNIFEAYGRGEKNCRR